VNPTRQVFGVTQFPRNTEFSAQIRARQFRDQFFKRIGIIAEAFTELARETMLRAGPMRVMPISA
jgi:hypothetical protein